MNLFVLNLFLALVWALLQGGLQEQHLVVGFILGYAIIGLVQQALGSRGYAIKGFQLIYFVLFVVWEIITASIALAWLLLQPRLKLSPAVVAIDLDVKSDTEIVLLANLITLSPGTLTLDISSDRRTLYVHTVTLEDPETFRHKIKNGLERQVLEVMR
jgi:multicomponent Na+:H+ antiporter subunit E